MRARPERIVPWGALVEELNEWDRRGLTARFWVRDDDAIALSHPLDRLTAMANAAQVEVGLAVIPARLTEPLSAYLLSGESRFYPMCHGWRHRNYWAPLRPSEFGPERPLSVLKDEAKAAFDSFSRRFKDIPVIFVPPFARISAALIEELPNIGFAGLSISPTVAERRSARLASRWAFAAPSWFKPTVSVRPYDVHIDPFDWRRGTARAQRAIERQLIGYLRVRRMGLVPAISPIGVLTHHLVFDEDTWAICQEMLVVLAGHSAVSWPSLRKSSGEEAPADHATPEVARA